MRPYCPTIRYGNKDLLFANINNMHQVQKEIYAPHGATDLVNLSALIPRSRWKNCLGSIIYYDDIGDVEISLTRKIEKSVKVKSSSADTGRLNEMMKMAKNGIEALFKPSPKIHSEGFDSYANTSYVQDGNELPLYNAIEVAPCIDSEADMVGEIKPQPSGQWVAPRTDEISNVIPTTLGSELACVENSLGGHVSAFSIE